MKNRFQFILTLLIICFTIQQGYSQQNAVVQNIINQVNIDSLTHYVKELSGNIPTIIGGQTYTIVSRHKNQPGNDKAMEYIKQKLEQYGLTTTIQTFSTTGKNVYAVQTGTEFPNKKFIICAHFDDMPSGTTAPGADDNASGTAAVIEAARILRNYSFPYTIVYALWDEEEQGLIGSAYYANQAATAGDSILGVLNMDMISYDGNNDSKANIHTRGVANSLMLSDKMLAINTTYSIGVNTVIKTPGSTASDHASFWNKSYSAILLIEDDDNDFHPYYHTVNDVLTYFNFPYFHKLSKMTIGTLATLALNLNLSIQHTPFAAINTSNPITINATVVTGLTVGTGAKAPLLYYRVNSGSGFTQFNSVTGVPVDATTNFNFTIPSQAMGSIVQYYIACQDQDDILMATLPMGGSGMNPPGSTPPPTFFQFFVAASSLAFSDSANAMSQWTPTGTWGLATNKYVSAPTSFTDSPSGNYVANSNTTLLLINNIDLTNILGARLEFDTQWEIETDWDYGQIHISSNNGSTWTPLAGNYTNAGTGSFQPNGEPLYDGTQTTWVKESIDLSSYTGKQIKLRFMLKSDGSQQRDGWYIDNVTVSKYSSVPVELLQFTAMTDGNKVSLNWETASETNNRGFEILRSSDKINWSSIGFVDGFGTSSEEHNYSFSDLYPVNSKSFYSIKQIDFNGEFKIYGPIEVEFTGNMDYTLEQNYPNPFNPSTSIKFSIKEKGNVSLTVFDLLGREITTLLEKEMEAGSYSISFDASNLVSGVYVYQLKSGNFIASKKMMLVK